MNNNPIFNLKEEMSEAWNKSDSLQRCIDVAIDYSNFNVLTKNNELITIKYDWHIFTIEFLCAYKQRRYWKDKCFPLTTQCLIKMDGLLIGFGEVVKHKKDIENKRHGKLYAFKKAIANSDYDIWDEMKKRLFFKVLESV